VAAGAGIGQSFGDDTGPGAKIEDTAAGGDARDAHELIREGSRVSCTQPIKGLRREIVTAGIVALEAFVGQDPLGLFVGGSDKCGEWNRRDAV
jgi:hypothetical protein